MYDCPPDPTPLYIFLSAIGGWLAFALLSPLLRRVWARVSTIRVDIPVPVALVERCVCACRSVARVWLRVLSAVRYCLNPAAERRRKLGRYLASLPPHSGLTVYEEYLAEIDALPSCAARQCLRRNLARMMPRPSAGAIAKARARRGRSRAPEGLIRCLLNGVKPDFYRGID